MWDCLLYTSLAKNGVEPLDSYVVDDGWNNYYSVIGDTTYVGPGQDSGSGTPNQTGFWEFNLSLIHI